MKYKQIFYQRIRKELKMNVRMIGLSTLAALGVGLSSCNEADNYFKSIEENSKKTIINNGVAYNDYINMGKRIDSSVAAKPFLSRYVSRDVALGWKNEANKILKAKCSADSAKKIQAIIDSTRNATRKQIFDSLELAKKAIKHLK